VYEEKKLMLPETSLQLVSLGYDADNATLKGTSREGFIELVEQQMFNQLKSPMVLFNHGGSFEYNSYLNLENHNRQRVHFVRFKLPTFGFATVGEDEARFMSFYTINNGTNLEQCFSLSTAGLTLSMGHGERYHYHTIGLHDAKLSHEFTIWPFGDDKLQTQVIVPYLEKEKRDTIFWRKIAELSGATLGDAYDTKDEEGYPVVAYDLKQGNTLVDKLTVSSSQQYYGREYLVHIEFNNAVNPKDFAGYERMFGGVCTVKVDGEYVSCAGKPSKKIDASIDRGRGYLVLELVKHVLGYDAKKLQGQ
jgi:hypothetical protein